ncbi:MAG: hypothetical protein J2O44_01665 [Porphyrobacter sp.]|nr:hypothetical protein [Porphyrobacter sp.]
MPPSLILALGIPGFALLAYLFGHNAWKGLRTGEVYAKSYLYKRSESPVFFWIALALSAIVAIMCVTGSAIAAWALIEFG